jgi:hypothetical protein
VPWGTKVRYETMSGSIEAMALVGDQKYRTVSGDIRLWSLGGLVEAGSISGSITLDNGGDVRLRANTISGGIKVRARRFYGMALSSTSGSIAVVGALDPSGDHRAESISGSVDLTPLNGVTAELRAVSGSITRTSSIGWKAAAATGARSSATAGRSSRSIPRPAACASWRPGPGDYVVAAAAPARPRPRRRAAPALGVRGRDSGRACGRHGRSSRAAGNRRNLEPGRGRRGRTRPPAEDEELAVLQALERGEIGVDEAAERLERSRR